LDGSGCGVMAEDLARAALAALDIPRERCRAFALSRTMAESTKSFLNNVKAALPPLSPLR